jgi:hypothetical protein
MLEDRHRIVLGIQQDFSGIADLGEHYGVKRLGT